MTVTLYTKPHCVQCTATYRALNDKGIEYDVVDISEDEQALAYVKELGHLSAPVVVAREGDQIVNHWSGFNPTEIGALQAA